MKSNHLSDQTSPYLLQHAHNPVEWYPWGEEALHKAIAENKPILLSIGYSACHWCHVMAHESFEDEQTAKLMNQLFVNIKVDREERPDLDNIYQTAHQILTRSSGGWPLTVFLDPIHHVPFFTGTYFPKAARYQLPAFTDLLQQLADFYAKNYREIQQKAPELTNFLKQLDKTDLTSDQTLNLQPWNRAVEKLSAEYDPENGGFGGSPKFPNPSNLALFINDAYTAQEKTIDTNSFAIVKTTLTKMALAGIYDQLGGGFYRYSVDAQWEIPHFEKMLYDNAQLLYQYAQGYQLTEDPLFKKIITETANWVMHKMQSKEGGYFSALDADSEGKEGSYYLWTPEQVKLLVSDEEYKLLLAYFNLSKPENFEERWHLHITHSLENIAQETQKPLAELLNLYHSARMKLLNARDQRIAPGTDDKVLTAWNALMIKDMVQAGATLVEPAWIDSAERALNFIYKTMWRDGRLLASYRNQRAHLSGYVDDYAFLLDAILVFLQQRWRTEYLLFAIELAEVLLQHFLDKEHANFFFISDEHESLIYRPKIMIDGVTPAGSSVACYSLQRLGYLLAEPRYLEIAEKSLKFAFPDIGKYPASHITLLLTLRDYLSPPKIIIVRGEGENLKPWQAALSKYHNPATMIFTIDKDQINLPAALAEKLPGEGVVAYICQGQQCLPSINDLEQLITVIAL